MNSNDSSGRPPRQSNRSSPLSGHHKPTPRQNTNSGSKSTSSKSASDKSPSNSATHNNGIATVNRRLRSLLSHHLALPLFYAFNAIEEPNNKPLYRATKDTEIKDASGLDTIFERAVLEWHGDGNGKKVERDLTYLIRELIRAHAVCTGAEKKISCSEHEPCVRNASPSGRGPAKRSIDILLSDISKEATPLALVEVGRINEDWWKKLDQAGKYLDIMKHENNLELKFNDCILCAVLTFEGDPTSQDFQSRFGVFLCWPKSEKPWQMALLWRASGVNLTQASKNFGMFLRVVYSFAAWRKENLDFDYHYLSSSVCRIKNKIYRSFDCRVRATIRSPDIYFECQDIVGGPVREIVGSRTAYKIAANSAAEAETGDASFWSSEDRLLIVELPYKDGDHLIQNPTDFLPIIDQLQKLHARGYVHGDIRGFNVVFGRDGGLIDFDLGGKAEERTYPPGYRKVLVDGERKGTGDAGQPNNQLRYFHDWFALGQLIFVVHKWKKPTGEADADVTNVLQMSGKWNDISDKWNDLKTTPSADDILELKEKLQLFEIQKFEVCPKGNFADDLGRFQSRLRIDTFGGTTGSP